MYFWPSSSPTTLTVAIILESKTPACSGDSVLAVFFAKCLLKISKMQMITLDILGVALKFDFKRDLARIHCFVIHSAVENLVALTCMGSRTSF